MIQRYSIVLTESESQALKQEAARSCRRTKDQARFFVVEGLKFATNKKPFTEIAAEIANLTFAWNNEQGILLCHCGEWNKFLVLEPIHCSCGRVYRLDLLLDSQQSDKDQ